MRAKQEPAPYLDRQTHIPLPGDDTVRTVSGGTVCIHLAVGHWTAILEQFANVEAAELPRD